jgi:hypothetical protein
MRMREGQKSPFAGPICTSNSIEINLDFSHRTAVSNGLRQAGCPFPHKWSLQDNLGSIAKKQNRGSQHDDNLNAASLPSRFKHVTDCYL